MTITRYERRITKNGHTFNVAQRSPGSWEVRTDFWETMEDGRWEPFTFELFDKLLTPETTYLDLGAWLGPTVLYASRLCKQCYAFEPDPVAYVELLDNLFLNSIVNVLPFQQAVMSHEGTAILGANGLGNSMTRIGQEANRFEVSCITLRSFWEEFEEDLKGPVFLKMDVEGAEELILEDVELFREKKPTLYLSTHPFWFNEDGAQRVEQIAALYKHNYEIAPDAFLFTDDMLVAGALLHASPSL